MDVDRFEQRVDVFSDTDEIVDGLIAVCEGHDTGIYWIPEAIEHIRGQDALIKEMLDAIKTN